MHKSELAVRTNPVEVQGLVRRYATTLETSGYRPSVVRAYCSAVEHFLCWAAPDNARLEMSQAVVRRFFNEHLADCQCQGRVQRGTVTVRPALNRLLAMCSELGVLVSEAKFAPHVEAELQGFC